MNARYEALVQHIANQYGVSTDHVHTRVESRRRRLHGFLSRSLAARTVAASLSLSAFEQKVSGFLASGAHHISGLQVSDAIAAASNEARAGKLSTLGYWPKAGEAPDAIAAHYCEGIDAIAQAGTPSSISIKVDLLQYERGVLLPMIRHAMSRGVRVHFDAQGFESADRTFELVEECAGMGADVSATLPSRWARSFQDADLLIRLGLPMRIVKGQGGDPGHPKIDPRRSYLELVEHVAGRARHVGVATHDRRTAEPALDMLLAKGTSCSLEQLRSLPRLDFLADERGIPVRAYVAYGQFGLPYAVGEIIRRPAIVGWILRDLVLRHRSASDSR